MQDSYKLPIRFSHGTTSISTWGRGNGGGGRVYFQSRLTPAQLPAAVVREGSTAAQNLVPAARIPAEPAIIPPTGTTLAGRGRGDRLEVTGETERGGESGSSRLQRRRPAQAAYGRTAVPGRAGHVGTGPRSEGGRPAHLPVRTGQAQTPADHRAGAGCRVVRAAVRTHTGQRPGRSGTAEDAGRPEPARAGQASRGCPGPLVQDRARQVVTRRVHAPAGREAAENPRGAVAPRTGRCTQRIPSGVAQLNPSDDPGCLDLGSRSPWPWPAHSVRRDLNNLFHLALS